MKNILVTGGSGFIGGNFVRLLLSDYEVELSHVTNLDSLTYAANPEYLKDLSDHSKYQFVEGDIRDEKLVRKVFEENEIDTVFHLAAESHVDNSITGPKIFIETNILGTFNLLQAALSYWSTPQSGRFVHISTDEVYGSLGDSGCFTEETNYAPNSPYSASKASSDFLVRAYHHTYGMNTVTTNCSNNYGPNQNREKLIPTVLRKALSGESIPIYGDGQNVRDWLFVKDHCEGLWQAGRRGHPGESYNFGGNNEVSNIELAKQLCTLLDKKRPRSNGKSYSEQIALVEDRPGHDFRYAIDATKAQRELGWQPKETFVTGIEKTIDWYLEII